MKKCFLLVLTVILLFGVASASAGIDLSGMSFEELVVLKDRINKAIWESEQWQEVTVPQGVYTVGEDIPAGHWTIRPGEGQWIVIKWGDTLEASGRDIDYSRNLYESEVLTSSTNRTYRQGDRTEIDYVLEDGQYVVIESGDAVFSPYAGKPSLGFK